MQRLRRWCRAVIAAGLAATVLLLGWGLAGGRSQDLPWTPLDLGDPVGAATGIKLAALDGAPARCLALIRQAGLRTVSVPPRREGACGFDDGLRFASGGVRQTTFAPAQPVLACPLAAALAMWEWDVVEPAAHRRFGTAVTRIDQVGTYACRRLYGRATGDWSEHARARAIDVSGFRLETGERITVAHDWRGHGVRAAFLHDVRDGACGLFATVLSPDYNAAHAGHLHLDQAARGAVGAHACR